MEIIGIIVTVLFGCLLCFVGLLNVIGNDFFGGSKKDIFFAWVLFAIGIVIIVWTIYTNVSITIL